MNILILGLRENNPNIGGIENVSWQLAKEWKDMGCQVFSLSFLKSHIPSDCQSVFEESYYFPNTNYGTFAEENKEYLLSLICKHDIQIILNQISNLPSVLSLCYKVKQQVTSPLQWITTVHYDINFQLKARRNNFFIKELLGTNLKLWIKDIASFAYFQFFQKYKIVREERDLYLNMVRVSDKTVLLSDASLIRLADMLPSSERGKLYSIPNPIELQPICSLSKKKQLLYVGRLELGLKRVDRLIKIWSVLEPEFPEWEFVIVGDGDYRYFYESMCRDLGLKNIRFIGYTNPATYYSESPILCLSSSSEGFGMVLIEAQMHGCIPVAYDSFDTLHEIIEHGKTGFAVKSFDKHEYTSCLRRLMTDEPLRSSMSEECKRSVVRFDSKQIASRWIKLFEDKNSTTLLA